MPTAVAVLPALDRVVVINPSFTNGPNGQFGHGELHIVRESAGRVLFTQEVSAEGMAVSPRAYLTDANNLLTIIDIRTDSASLTHVHAHARAIVQT